MQAVAGLRIVRHSGHYGNALLTRHPVLAVRRHDLSFSWREPRGALDVDLDVHGTEARIIVTHLGLTPGERRHQMRAILQIVATGSAATPVVLLGDINEWLPLGRPLRWLHAVFGRPPAPRSFPAFWPLVALDRIWAEPRTALRQCMRIGRRPRVMPPTTCPLPQPLLWRQFEMLPNGRDRAGPGSRWRAG